MGVTHTRRLLWVCVCVHEHHPGSNHAVQKNEHEERIKTCENVKINHFTSYFIIRASRECHLNRLLETLVYILMFSARVCGL